MSKYRIRNSSDIRVYKSRFIEMFGSPIKNEFNWEVKKIKDISPPQHFDLEFESDEVWMLNLDKIESSSGKIIEKIFVHKSMLGSSVYCFDSSCVLYSKLRPNLNKVVVPNDKGYATSELIPLKPDAKRLNKYFYAQVLLNKDVVDFFSLKVSGSKMPRVMMNELLNFGVILPPLYLQDEYIQFIHQIDKSKFILLFTSLLEDIPYLLGKF